MAGPKVLIVDVPPPFASPEMPEVEEKAEEKIYDADESDDEEFSYKLVIPKLADGDQVLSALEWAGETFAGKPVKTILLVKFTGLSWSVFMEMLDKLVADGQIIRNGDRISWPGCPHEEDQA